MYQGVGGYDAVALCEVCVTGVVGDAASGLSDDERAGHVVPLAYVLLHIAVEGAFGHVAEGHGCGSNHADAGGAAVEGVYQPVYGGAVGIAVVGQLQTEQGA